jgi:hypothetical protein
VGVLLPLARDVPWQRSYEIALAAQSPLWGGQANLVFPASDDILDNELFWVLAERFDADYFVSAAFTRRDVGEVNPQGSPNGGRAPRRYWPVLRIEENAQTLPVTDRAG